VARANAHLVSQVDGGRLTRHAVGCERGAAIAELKARGWRVLFYPFLFMDVAAGNALADPIPTMRRRTASRPILARPRHGQPGGGLLGSVDKTAAAATQVGAFFNGEWATAAWCCITPGCARRLAASTPS